MDYPVNILQLDPDEKIIAKVRRHWFYFLKEIAMLFVVLMVPVIIYMLVVYFDLKQYLHIPGDFFWFSIVLSALWGLAWWLGFYVAWTDFYLDVLIVTDKRIFDIEQKGLFFRDSSSFRLDRVQDITIQVEGVMGTLLGFGHIHIQTAGERREFIATFIPHPHELMTLISQHTDRAIEQTKPPLDHTNSL